MSASGSLTSETMDYAKEGKCPSLGEKSVKIARKNAPARSLSEICLYLTYPSSCTFTSIFFFPLPRLLVGSSFFFFFFPLHKRQMRFSLVSHLSIRAFPRESTSYQDCGVSRTYTCIPMYTHACAFVCSRQVKFYNTQPDTLARLLHGRSRERAERDSVNEARRDNEIVSIVSVTQFCVCMFVRVVSLSLDRSESDF